MVDTLTKAGIIFSILILIYFQKIWEIIFQSNLNTAQIFVHGKRNSLKLLATSGDNNNYYSI